MSLIVDALRLGLLRRADPGAWPRQPGRVALSAIMILLLAIALSWCSARLRYGSPLQFDAQMLLSGWLYPLLVVAIVGDLTRRNGASLAGTTLAICTTTVLVMGLWDIGITAFYWAAGKIFRMNQPWATTWRDGVQTVVDAVGGWRNFAWLLFAIALVHLLLALARLMAQSAHGGGRAFFIAAFALCSVQALQALDERDGYWVPAAREPSASSARDNRPGPHAEVVLERQRTLLDERLAELEPQRPGVVDLYAVGMAPDGSEAVFGLELDTFGPLFDARFDTAGRRVRLDNGRGQHLESAFATRTNLKRTLAHIGRLMDPAEDVLLLYLSAHGSDHARLSARLGRLDIESLDARALDEDLRSAGIRHAVIVISACYSGSWIPTLSDPERLVITASSATRTSFGCGNDSTFTWFGKAYIDEALRTTHDFIEAYRVALPVIAAREKEHDFEPSDPQLSMGDALESTLHRLVTRLEALDNRPAR